MKTSAFELCANCRFIGHKPVTVYQKLLERLEDIEDLKLLEDMRKKPLKFKPREEAMVQKESPDVL